MGALLSVETISQFDTLHQRVCEQFTAIDWPNMTIVFQKPEILPEPWLRIGLSSWVRVDAQVRHAASLQAAYPIQDMVHVRMQTLI